MKITCISDTHTFHRHLKLSGGDILIHCGDHSWLGQQIESFDFLEWMAEQKYAHKVFIAGNHELGWDGAVPLDRIFRGLKIQTGNGELYRKTSESLGLTYLENSFVTIEGLKIYGTPYTPEFNNWGFQKPRQGRPEFYGQIPSDTDILISHGPPEGILDDGLGCPDLRRIVDNLSLKLHVFGHIHETAGRDYRHGRRSINAAMLNGRHTELRTPFNTRIKP